MERWDFKYIIFRPLYILNTILSMVIMFLPYYLISGGENYFDTKAYTGVMEWLDKQSGLNP